MNRTRSFAAVALSLGMLSSAAMAADKWVGVSESTMLMPWNVSADKVGDMDVMGANGEKIGEVEKVIGTNETTPTALVVDFDDDSGYGDRDNVVIPVADFGYANNMLSLKADAAKVGGMQTWDD